MKIIDSNIGVQNYFLDKQKKTQIFLHHTVSQSAASSINWFKQLKYKIATAYVIDKDGTIFKLFEPENWAWHLGKYATTSDNANSVGIEIVNEGGLKKAGDKFYWFDGRYKYYGEPFKLETPWRGYKYFASYTKEQVASVAKLTIMLCKKFKIRRKVYNKFDFNLDLLSTYSGILFHCNVHADKTDISPAFPIIQLSKKVERNNVRTLKEKITNFKDKITWSRPTPGISYA